MRASRTAGASGLVEPLAVGAKGGPGREEVRRLAVPRITRRRGWRSGAFPTTRSRLPRGGPSVMSGRVEPGMLGGRSRPDDCQAERLEHDLEVVVAIEQFAQPGAHGAGLGLAELGQRTVAPSLDAALDVVLGLAVPQQEIIARPPGLPSRGRARSRSSFARAPGGCRAPSGCGPSRRAWSRT